MSGMSILLEDQPSLTDLHALIAKVSNYPITAKQLVELAAQNQLPKAVIDFYRAFPADEVFKDKEDLLARTESVEMLRHQSAPREEMHAPEED